MREKTQLSEQIFLGYSPLMEETRRLMLRLAFRFIVVPHGITVGQVDWL